LQKPWSGRSFKSTGKRILVMPTNLQNHNMLKENQILPPLRQFPDPCSQGRSFNKLTRSNKFQSQVLNQSHRERPTLEVDNHMTKAGNRRIRFLIASDPSGGLSLVTQHRREKETHSRREPRLPSPCTLTSFLVLQRPLLTQSTPQPSGSNFT
jgi:hypothetical protein